MSQARRVDTRTNNGSSRIVVFRNRWRIERFAFGQPQIFNELLTRRMKYVDTVRIKRWKFPLDRRDEDLRARDFYHHQARLQMPTGSLTNNHKSPYRYRMNKINSKNRQYPRRRNLKHSKLIERKKRKNVRARKHHFVIATHCEQAHPDRKSNKPCGSSPRRMANVKVEKVNVLLEGKAKVLFSPWNNTTEKRRREQKRTDLRKKKLEERP